MSFNFFTPLLFVIIFLTPPSYSATPAQPDDDTQKVLDTMAKFKTKPIENLTAPKARLQPTIEQALGVIAKKEKNLFLPLPITYSERRVIDVAHGKIPINITWQFKEKNMPVIIYYHPGGFVLGSIENSHGSAVVFALKTGAIVVEVDYRRAPEYKFPTAHSDAYMAYKWVLANAKSFGGDPTRVALVGEDAGGNLALNVAIRAVREHIQKPIHEVIFYPIADTSMNTPSYTVYAKAKPLNEPMMSRFLNNYQSKPADLNDPRLNLVKNDFRGINPVTLITAEIDPLKSEGLQLVNILKNQNVVVSHKHFEGVTHEFFSMLPVVRKAYEALDFASDDLTLAFTDGKKTLPQAQEVKKTKP